MKSKTRIALVSIMLIVALCSIFLLVSCDDKKQKGNSPAGEIFKDTNLEKSSAVFKTLQDKIKETKRFQMNNEVINRGVLQEKSTMNVGTKSIYAYNASNEEYYEIGYLLEGEDVKVYLNDKEGWQVDTAKGVKTHFEKQLDDALYDLVEITLDPLCQFDMIYNPETKAFNFNQEEIFVEDNGIRMVTKTYEEDKVVATNTTIIKCIVGESEFAAVEGAKVVDTLCDNNTVDILNKINTNSDEAALAGFYGDTDLTNFDALANLIIEKSNTTKNLSIYSAEENYIDKVTPTQLMRINASSNGDMTNDPFVSMYQTYSGKDIITIEETKYTKPTKSVMTLDVDAKESFEGLVGNVITNSNDLLNSYIGTGVTYNEASKSFKANSGETIKFFNGGYEVILYDTTLVKVFNVGVTKIEDMTKAAVEPSKVFNKDDAKASLNKALELVTNGENYTLEADAKIRRITENTIEMDGVTYFSNIKGFASYNYDEYNEEFYKEEDDEELPFIGKYTIKDMLYKDRFMRDVKISLKDYSRMTFVKDDKAVALKDKVVYVCEDEHIKLTLSETSFRVENEKNNLYVEITNVGSTQIKLIEMEK